MPATSLSFLHLLLQFSYLFTDREKEGVVIGGADVASLPARQGDSDGWRLAAFPTAHLLTGPMLYSWDLGQERDAKRFKNILRNSLRCQPSCQVVLSNESQELHPYTHMQSGGICSKFSFFNLLLSQTVGKHQLPTVWACQCNYSLLRKLHGKWSFPRRSIARS